MEPDAKINPPPPQMVGKKPGNSTRVLRARISTTTEEPGGESTTGSRALVVGFSGLAATVTCLTIADLLFQGNLIGLNSQSIAGVILALLVTSALGWLHQKRQLNALQAQTAILGNSTRELESSIEVLNDVNWELRESEERYRGLVDSQGDIIIRRDKNGRLIFVNDVFCSTFGLNRKMAIGHQFDPTILEGSSPRPVKTESDGDKSHYRCDQRLKTVDGARWFAWEDFVLRSASGQLREVQSVGRDITERKRAETEIAIARDSAETANRAKSMFLATMSHEIRTPMNGVLGMAGLLLDSELTPAQRTYANAVKTSGDALLNIIDEILDYSKIEAGKMKLEPGPFDITELMRGVAELLAPKAHQKNIDLGWLVHAGVPNNLIGDEKRLRQILLNLAGNATKFTESGGVSLEVSRRASPIDRDGTWFQPLHFSICDTGIGIEPGSIDTVFEEFRQVDEAPSRKYGGTGLGLAISKKIVDQMNGSLGLNSKVGEGSQFHFDIDLEISTTTSEYIPEPAKLSGHRVLFISNHAIETSLMAKTLEWAGADVTITNSLQTAAMRLPSGLAACPFDTILFDLDMTSDFNILLKSVTKRPRTITLLSPEERDQLEKLRGSGIDAYLLRPVRPHSLLTQIVGLASGKVAIEEPIEPAPKASPKVGQPLKILLAEDNEINAMLANALLTRDGHQVQRVEDGKQAIAYLERATIDQVPFDLILMDIHMPELDGMEATRRIRAMPLGPDNDGPAATPIIALTANAMTEDRDRCLAVGMDDYISKPLAPEDLQRIVAQWSGVKSKVSASGLLVA